MRKFIAMILLFVLIIGLMGCANAEPPATATLPLSTMPAEKWFDFYRRHDEMPWDDTLELELPEFPGVTFTWSWKGVTATCQNGVRGLFGGMPTWNVYLADVTGNGLPDFAATISFGSGIVDTRVVVYDFANDERYVLSDRAISDYALSMDNGNLIVIQTPWMSEKDKQVGLAFDSN
jgi:hypothetical protein